MNEDRLQASCDSFGVYLKRIGKYPLLTAQEEITLGRQVSLWQKVLQQRAVGGGSDVDVADRLGLSVWEVRQAERLGPKARQELIQRNIRLVVAIAKKYSLDEIAKSSLSIEDLISEGSIGLARAAEKFDYRKGYRFSTYAYWWIKQSITRAINQQSRAIRLPVHLNEFLSDFKSVSASLSRSLGRNPTREEIVEGLLSKSATRSKKSRHGSDFSRVSMAARLDALLAASRVVQSLDTPVSGERNSSCFGDFIPSGAGEPDDYVLALERKEICDRLLACLPPEDLEVVKMKFFEGMTNAQIAESLGDVGDKISKQGVAGRVKRATRRMKNLLQSTVWERA